MEQNFQTSFIPKNPIIEKRAVTTQPVSILVIFSIFILFTVCLATGGLYLYKDKLTKNLAELNINLGAAHNKYEPNKLIQ